MSAEDRKVNSVKGAVYSIVDLYTASAQAGLTSRSWLAERSVPDIAIRRDDRVAIHSIALYDDSAA